MAYYLLQAVFIPLLLAPLAYYIARKYGVGPSTWFTFGIMLYSTIMLIIPYISGSYAEFYPWNQLGEFGLVLDGLSSPFALMIYILSTVLVLYSRPYMIHKITEEYHHQLTETNDAPVKMKNQQVPIHVINHNIGIYYGLFLLFVVGMLGTVLASNLVQFYVFFELMLIPSFFLIAFYGYGAKRRIALMFFFWTHVGAVVLLIALIAMGISAGSFDMAEIMESSIAPDLLPLIAAGIIIGLAVKLAIFLVHIWLPHAHAEAPTPISALLSPAMIGIGGYALMRLLMVLLPEMYQETSLYLSIWAFITMAYGGAMALMQDDVKRILAYSSISQMGYFIFGFASLNAIGVTGSVMLYISHGTGKALLFMMAGMLILQVGRRSLSKLGGLAGKLPITTTTAIIGALAIMGIPPTNGFMGEWMLFYGALQTALAEGSMLRIIVFGLALSTTVLTAGYLLWMIKRIFFGKLAAGLEKVKEGSLYMTVPMMMLALLTIVIGIYPEIFTSTIIPFMQSIIG
ncbi:MAG: formate hydrogenlyase [Thaumarchaeota archaeon]|nr:formate hydrogenlyase [Nitrososphaerota archaeon]